MNEQQAKIQEDLRGLLSGDVNCDDVSVQLFASDASIYQINPLGVIRPRHHDDVVACVQYAQEHHLAIHARGGGSGLAGESLGAGLVLDFSKYMRRLAWIDETRIRAQPGVTLRQVNEWLATRGRTFGPDPANGLVTTVGSLVAINGAGSHSLKHGSARDYIERLEIVTADGQSFEIGQEPLPGTTDSVMAHPTVRAIVGEVTELLQKNADLLEKFRPKSRFNRSGYAIFDVLSEHTLDLARLLVGSEGTLALATDIVLNSVPLPKDVAVGLFFFDRVESAARVALEIQSQGPSACDLLDRRLLSLAKDMDPRYDLVIPPPAEAALLVEMQGDVIGEAQEKLTAMVEFVRQLKPTAFDSVQASDPHEVDLFWQLARKVVPSLYRLKGSTRPVPCIEDVAVPPAELPGFLVKVQNLFKKHQVTASLFAHAGHGQLHFRPFLDLSRPDDVRTMRNLAAELYQQVFAIGGTIAGEHGDGLSRTPYVPLQYGELYAVFRELKRIFDPHNILNPGKIVGDDPFLMIRNLRENAALSGQSARAGNEPLTPEVVPLQLHWTPAEVAQTARTCNGCGLCRSESPKGRMCPIFRFAGSEEAAPRAKANLMRAVMAGDLSPDAIATPEFKAVVDLCVNCKMCKLECPAGVDIPKLVLEAKAGYVAQHGLSTTNWILSRLDLVSAIGSYFAPLANWAIANPKARWVIEKVLGIAQGRKLPRFATRPFLRRAARRRLTRPTGRSGRKVLYFVDTYANYHDPQLAEAFVSILEHNGIAVYVHPGQIASGMSLITAGAVDRARQVARHNLALLAEGVRQGYTIVATEPAAIVCLTQEYPDLLEDNEAQIVAEHTVEACTYLWKLHREGLLRLDLQPIAAQLAYHQPCHIRALGVGSPGENLLWLIPKLKLRTADHGCSGMAGTWGLARDNYRSSLRAGYDLLVSMRDATIDAGATECSACRLQMEQGTTKPTIHPIKLLALSYGLMPEIAALLAAKSEELVAT